MLSANFPAITFYPCVDHISITLHSCNCMVVNQTVFASESEIKRKGDLMSLDTPGVGRSDKVH